LDNVEARFTSAEDGRKFAHPLYNCVADIVRKALRGLKRPGSAVAERHR